MTSSLFVCLAHGECWEVAASRAVGDLVKQILEEQGAAREKLEDNGSFELHYTPADANRKSFTVPLTTRQMTIDCE